MMNQVRNRNIYKNKHIDDYDLVDRRLRDKNQMNRFNIRRRNGTRVNVYENLENIKYFAEMVCNECGINRPVSRFQNRTIAEDLREITGFNVRCEFCNKKQKTHGYRVDDFIVEEEDVEWEEDVEEDVWTRNHPSVGKKVMAYFNLEDGSENLFSGRVYEYLPESQEGARDQLYKIHWEDGDICDYDQKEWKKARALYKSLK